MRFSKLNIYKTITYLFLIIFLFNNFSILYSKQTKHSKKKNNKILVKQNKATQNKLYDIFTEEELIAQISKILSKNKLKADKYSLAIYSLDNKKYIYSYNLNQPLVPASNMKLLITFTALAKLGTNYKLETKILTDGKIDKNGILNGNIYLVGYGDPLLSLSDIENMVEEIRLKGIKEITGNIIYDDSFFDHKKYRIQYSGDKELVQYVAPISALNIEKNTLTIRILSGSANSKKPKIQVIPECDAIKVINNLNIIKATKKYNFSKGLKIQNINEDSVQTLIISGQIPENKTIIRSYEIFNPSLVCASLLKSRIQSFGIKFNGNIKSNTNDISNNQKTNLATTGRNIIDITYLINKNSDNYLAESLFKIIGAYFNNDPDNSISAKLEVFKLLDSLQIPSSNIVINDGSGLSRDNKLNTNLLIKLLNYIYLDQKLKILDSTLAIAGVDGTLQKRLKNTLAFNNLRAKTGTHNTVSSLAGFIRTKNNENISFAMIFNGGYTGKFKIIEDEICTLIANFERKE